MSPINPFPRELKEIFATDHDYAFDYAEAFMNTTVAAQIKVLREQRGWTQEELAEKIGTQQAGISRLENVNYSNWKTRTLWKLARALGVRLRVTFEEFGTLPDDFARFDRSGLRRRTLTDDPYFTPMKPSGKEGADKLLAAEIEEQQTGFGGSVISIDSGRGFKAGNPALFEAGSR